MISERGHHLIARGAAFFIACGFAARFLLLDDVSPVVEATGIGLLSIGSGLVLLARAARGEAIAGAPILLMPLLLAWAARSLEPLALKRAIDVWIACMAGLAIRDLVRRGGLGPAVRMAVVTAAAVLGTFGIAQTLYLRREAADIAHEMSHALTMTDLGRAFLESRRAAATFVSPNAFGGFLLLFGIPLLASTVAALRGSARGSAKAAACVLGALVLAAFACAGSAGAALSGALGCLLVSALAARGRLRTVLLAALVAAMLAAIALVAAAASATDPSGKLRTLQERIDYHKAGIRMLHATWPEGAGLEQTRLLAKSATAGTEAFSRSIHDWWLQGLVEGGVAFIPVAAALLWAIASGVAAAASRRPASGASAATLDPAGPRAWRRGLASGAIIALVLQPFVTVIPYGAGPPIVHAAAMAAVALGLGLLASRVDLSDPAFSTGACAGCVAFAIHGLVDYDLYVPGVMLAFATALALLPDRTHPASDPRRSASALARGLTLFHGIASLLAPLAIVLMAETREHAH